ncbi:hypothetical protein K2X89_14465 [Myxococcota bacterium]|nr:hypothetical protein [Myxococcota bacterium]
MLPSSAAAVPLDANTIVEDEKARTSAGGWRTASLAAAAVADAAIGDLRANDDARGSAPAASRSGGQAVGPTGSSASPTSGTNDFGSAFAAAPSEGTASLGRRATAEAGSSERGQALPGDRGPREGAGSNSPRPSFWRRIALGRRSQALRAAQQEGGTMVTTGAASTPGTEGRASELRSTPVVQRLVANRDGSRAVDRSALRDESALAARASEAVERRIVEPLLQALVSVEAKLERSHVDLVGRSDQVEQRLTQLWDIEEQLGALGELQESVLHVTEQQRRLEAALVAQTRILRWLVGGIILSLAVAAFSVAFFLRVTA